MNMVLFLHAELGSDPNDPCDYDEHKAIHLTFNERRGDNFILNAKGNNELLI